MLDRTEIIFNYIRNPIISAEVMKVCKEVPEFKELVLASHEMEVHQARLEMLAVLEKEKSLSKDWILNNIFDINV